MFHSSTNHSGNRGQSVKQGFQANSCSAQWEMVQNSFLQPLGKKGCKTSTDADSLPEYDALMIHIMVLLSRCLRATSKGFFISLSKGLCSLTFCNTELTSVNYFCITSLLKKNVQFSLSTLCFQIASVGYSKR